MTSIKKTVYGAIFISLISLIASCREAYTRDFRILGQLNMDAAYGINDANEFSNGFNNRRAQMGMAGTITKGWDGRIEIDFADGGIDMMNSRLRRSFENGGRLWIGQFKVPQGLDQLTSSNEIIFIERSTPVNIISDSRRLGIAYEHFRGNMGFKSMIFGRALGQRGDITGDMPLGVALRGVYMPEMASGLLHFGGSVVYEDLMDNNILRYGNSPEIIDSKGSSYRLIDITLSDTESTIKGGLELLLYIPGRPLFRIVVFLLQIKTYL